METWDAWVEQVGYYCLPPIMPYVLLLFPSFCFFLRILLLLFLARKYRYTVLFFLYCAYFFSCSYFFFFFFFFYYFFPPCRWVYRRVGEESFNLLCCCWIQWCLITSLWRQYRLGGMFGAKADIFPLIKPQSSKLYFCTQNPATRLMLLTRTKKRRGKKSVLVWTFLVSCLYSGS